MRLLRALRSHTWSIFFLIATLILLLPPAYLSADTSATTTPQFKLDNFKWKNVPGLEKNWWMDKFDSTAVEVPAGKDVNGFSFNQPCQYLRCDLYGGQEGETVDSNTPNIFVEMVWTQDTGKVRDLVNTQFAEIAGTEKDDSKDTSVKAVKINPSLGTDFYDRADYVYYTKIGNVYYLSAEVYVLVAPNTIISIVGQNLQKDFDETDVLLMLSSLEQKARDMLSSYAMSMVHYHPYAVTNPRHPGDIVATLTQNGKPAVGQQVYFFLDVAKSPTLSDSATFIFNTFGANFSAGGAFATLSHDYDVVTTDKSGEATFNYLSHGHVFWGALKPLEVALWLAHHKGTSAVFNITAVVFDEDPHPYWDHESKFEPHALAMANVEINIDSIARITRIIPTDPDHWPNPSVVVDKAGGASVSANVSANQIISLNAQPAGFFGYPLNLNDKVELDGYSSVFIQWINGTTLSFTPKIDWNFKKDGNASVYIGYTDSGYYDYINASASYFWGMAVAGFAGFACTCVGLKVTAAAAFAWGVASAFFGAIGCVGIAVYINEKLYNPIIVQYKSQVLFDLDAATTIYTVEGTANYYNPNDHSTVDVTTGHKLAITSDGKPGTVSTFKESELNPDMTGLLKSMRKQLAISNGTASITPSSSKSTTATSALTSQPGINQPSNSTGLIQNIPRMPNSGNSTISSFIWLIVALGGMLLVIFTITTISRRRQKPVLSVSQKPQTKGNIVKPLTPPAAHAPPAISGVKLCNRCGSQALDTDTYCNSCGAKLAVSPVIPDAANTGALVFCPGCGTKNQSGKNFCSHCGYSLPRPEQMPVSQATAPAVAKFCSVCGKPNIPEGSYCRNCGSPLKIQ